MSLTLHVSLLFGSVVRLTTKDVDFPITKPSMFDLCAISLSAASIVAGLYSKEAVRCFEKKIYGGVVTLCYSYSEFYVRVV